MKPGSGLPSFDLRTAVDTDADGILECLRAAFEVYRTRYTEGAYEDTVLTPETVRRRLGEMRIFVAIGDGEVAGTIACQVVGGAEGHLRGMAVLPKWHGAGIAQRLLERAEEYLREQGCTRITLDTTEPLERAMGFYERNGYRRSGRVQDFFGMRLIEYEKRACSSVGLSEVK